MGEASVLTKFDRPRKNAGKRGTAARFRAAGDAGMGVSPHGRVFLRALCLVVLDGKPEGKHSFEDAPPQKMSPQIDVFCVVGVLLALLNQHQPSLVQSSSIREKSELPQRAAVLVSGSGQKRQQAGLRPHGTWDPWDLRPCQVSRSQSRRRKLEARSKHLVLTVLLAAWETHSLVICPHGVERKHRLVLDSGVCCETTYCNLLSIVPSAPDVPNAARQEEGRESFSLWTWVSYNPTGT